MSNRLNELLLHRPEILMTLLKQSGIKTGLIQEEFKVLLLNRAKKGTGLYEASTGGKTETVADTRLILAVAIKGLAVSIILCHNLTLAEIYNPARRIIN